MLRLNEKNTRKVANAAGINEKAVFRLTRSLKVSVGDGENTKTYELGFTINEPYTIAKIQTEMGLKILAKTLREYMQLCPMVISWVGRGDFKADTLPERLTRANLLHASRTAGRLKAELLRALSQL